MKVGIYGGSFNPVHKDHEAIVNAVLERKIVDEVWLLPCKHHAFNKELVSAEHRVNMLKLVFDKSEKVRIDYTEINNDSKSYMADTLRALKKKHQYDFYFIAGIDALNEIDSWYDPEYMKNFVKFIAVQRKGYSLAVPDINLETMLENNFSISSTVIRSHIKEKKPINHLVHPEVEKYILENSLYQEEYKNPASTVDLIIVTNKNELVLIKRKDEPFKNFWALPGGFLEYGKETLEQAGVRELYEETSLKTSVENLRLIGTYSRPQRDPRGQVISHVYEVQQYSGTPKANDDAKEIKKFQISEIPKSLAFDHAEIINDYLMNRKENKQGR